MGTKRTTKACNRCGHDNHLSASACKACGCSRFAPAWVIAKRTINRQVSVEITEPNPKFGKADPRLTLSKWWPGGRASFHIPNVAQWEAIEGIVNEQLAPLLGWKKKAELLAAISKSKRRPASSEDYQRLLQEHPDFLTKVVNSTGRCNTIRQTGGGIDETFQKGTLICRAEGIAVAAMGARSITD